jgi:hypothetical protein
MGVAGPRAWTGTAGNRIIAVVGAVVLLAGAWSASHGSPGPAIPLVVVGLVSSLFSAVKVTVSTDEIAIAYGPLRWPVQRIRLASVAAANAEDFQAVSWGYRGGRRIFGRVAVVVRSGPALRIELRDGTTFTVTVDHPGDAAGVINDLVRQLD